MECPSERRFGEKPDVGVVRVFGCRELVHNPSPYPKRKPRARDAVLLSFGMTQFSFGTYKLWDLQSKSVIYSRDVHFFEDRTIKDTLEDAAYEIDGGSVDDDSSDIGSDGSPGSGSATRRRSSRILDSENLS